MVGYGYFVSLISSTGVHFLSISSCIFRGYLDESDLLIRGKDDAEVNAVELFFSVHPSRNTRTLQVAVSTRSTYK
jgi:hypothetical protein